MFIYNNYNFFNTLSNDINSNVKSFENSITECELCKLHAFALFQTKY